MKLHPWPLTEGVASTARQAVLWKNGGGASLLIDTPAIPLRFNDEAMLDSDDVMKLPAEDVESLRVGYADALVRIRELEAQLLCCRELGAR